MNRFKKVFVTAAVVASTLVAVPASADAATGKLISLNCRINRTATAALHLNNFTDTRGGYPLKERAHTSGVDWTAGGTGGGYKATSVEVGLINPATGAVDPWLRWAPRGGVPVTFRNYQVADKVRDSGLLDTPKWNKAQLIVHTKSGACIATTNL
ncbi:hypothetical protein ACIB24_07105 [Spongisporangium articulatum]|uniref:Secreted protein n=1 Tax=Spongisporangium articulatum TaxID=3362603 RepID=A0ABW8AKE4_9ACTN